MIVMEVMVTVVTVVVVMVTAMEMVMMVVMTIFFSAAFVISTAPLLTKSVRPLPTPRS